MSECLQIFLFLKTYSLYAILILFSMRSHLCRFRSLFICQEIVQDSLPYKRLDITQVFTQVLFLLFKGNIHIPNTTLRFWRPFSLYLYFFDLDVTQFVVCISEFVWFLPPTYATGPLTYFFCIQPCIRLHKINSSNRPLLPVDYHPL